jgi:hypothetical protein
MFHTSHVLQNTVILNKYVASKNSHCSGVSLATAYGLDELRDWNWSPGRVKDLHFSISSRLTLGPTPPEAEHTSNLCQGQKMQIYTSTADKGKREYVQ